MTITMTTAGTVKIIRVTLAFASVLAMANGGHAEMVLSLDARRGASPSQWLDLADINQPFSAVGNPTFNNGAFAFDGNDHFIGNSADEANFDFDTAKGGRADPFIVVTYFKHDRVDAEVGVSDGSLVNKVANLQGKGWMASSRIGFTGNPDGGPDEVFRSANIIQQPNLSTARAYSRPQNSFSPDTDWHLFVFEIDGSGISSEGHKLYADGGTTDLLDSSPFGDALTASVINDDALRIGGAVDANGLSGELQFVEIYTGTTVDNIFVSGMSAADYSRFRIANLDKIAIPATCDYNRDGVLNTVDVNLLRNEVKAGTNDAKFDVNRDGLVNVVDIVSYVESPEKLNTYVGDSNLDGQFNSTDLVVVFAAGQYEDAISMNSTWETGDWDGDGDFGTSDFVLAFTRGGFEIGPRGSITAVPEPSSVTLLSIAGVGLGVISRARRNRYYVLLTLKS